MRLAGLFFFLFIPFIYSVCFGLGHDISLYRAQVYTHNMYITIFTIHLQIVAVAVAVVHVINNSHLFRPVSLHNMPFYSALTIFYYIFIRFICFSLFHADKCANCCELRVTKLVKHGNFNFWMVYKSFRTHSLHWSTLVYYIVHIVFHLRILRVWLLSVFVRNKKKRNTIGFDYHKSNNLER